MKNEKMRQMKENLIKGLKGYSFGEMLRLLNSNSVPEVRDAIMRAMEMYHTTKFYDWLGRC